MEESPVPGDTMQEEVTAADDESAMMQLAEEDSFAGAVEAEEPIEEANGVEESLPEDETIEEIVKQPVKRGRKRKSDALEPVAETDSQKASTRRTRGAIAQPQSAEKATKAVQPSAPKPRGRPPKAKQPTSSAEEQPSFASNAAGEPEDAAAPPQKKPRGRRPRNQTQLDEATEEAVQPEEPGPSKGSRVLAKNQPSKQGPAKAAADQSTFKKPKAAAKSKSKAPENVTNLPDLSSGRFVDTFGKPLSKDDIDHRSTTTAGSRFSRARSIFCERKAEELGTVTRTGRRNIKPIDFWRNERAAYDMQGNLIAVRHNEYQPEPRRTQSRSKGKKKKHAAVEEEEEEELEEWESNDGVLVGSYRDYDPTTETTSDEQLDAGKSSSATYRGIACSWNYSHCLGTERHYTCPGSKRTIQVHEAGLHWRQAVL
jgi:centromere protein C